MAMPKVFISYGTQDAQSRELIKMLTPKLSGFEVFVDHTTLRGGDDWRHRLHTWLHLCSAAVLLLSDAALDSAWVTTEATILDHRRTIDDKLLVIPVLLGNVTPPDLLKPPYAALNLSASQWVRIGPGDLPGAKITEIAGLLQPIATHAEEGPLGRQRREVASLLRKIDDEIILTDADDVLEPDLQGWDSSPTLNLPLRVAHGLLTAPIEKVANAMEGLLAPLPSDVRRTLLDALSHVWIDVETAANLATAIKTWAAPAQAGRSGPLSRGRYAVNARNGLTGVYVIKRACYAASRMGWPAAVPTLDSDSSDVVDDSGGDQIGRLRRVMRERLRRAMGMLSGETTPLNEIIAEEALTDPVFIVLPLDPNDGVVTEADAEKLCSDFPDCTVLVLTGEAQPAAVAGGAAASTGPLGAKYLRPYFPKDREREALRLCRKMRRGADL